MAASKSKQKGIASVKKRIIPVREAQPYVKALLYGRNGKGKTRIAATGPKALLIDINEEGNDSIVSYPDVEVFKVRSWEDLTYAYWYLREGDHEHETVILDTLTQAQGLCMGHILKKAEDRDPMRPASMPRRQDWGQLKELLVPIIYDYRNLPMHVIFVCQEKIDKGGDDDEDVDTRYVPDMTPGVRGGAESAVALMGRVYQKPVRTVVPGSKKEKTVWETRMLIGPHEDYDTKNRYHPHLPHIVRKPTVPMMIDAKRKKVEEDGEVE